MGRKGYLCVSKKVGAKHVLAIHGRARRRRRNHTTIQPRTPILQPRTYAHAHAQPRTYAHAQSYNHAHARALFVHRFQSNLRTVQQSTAFLSSVPFALSALHVRTALHCTALHSCWNGAYGCPLHFLRAPRLTLPQITACGFCCLL